MAPVSNERSLWLGRHVLPHESALRAWLIGRRLRGLDIDDVIQDTYTRLMLVEDIQHIRNAKNYTFQTAASVVADQLRRMKVVPMRSLANFDQLVITSTEPSPEQQAVHRDELAQLAKAISSLPSKIRQVFTLRRIHALSQREVATRMGIAESTVEKHMSKGFLLICDYMAEIHPQMRLLVGTTQGKTDLAHVKKDSA